MKVIIVNCFDTYQGRVEFLHSYFNQIGYSVTVVTSDFRHIKKEYIIEKKKDYQYIKVKPYYKNLSVQRILSHYKFSKDAFMQIEEMNADLLWVLLPPNSLGVQTQKYKKKVQNVKVVFDFIDIWPETMPIEKFKKTFFYKYWKNMREKSINCADSVVTECDYYHEALSAYQQKAHIYTLHLMRDMEPYIPKADLRKDVIEICYLGSINNIVDIPMIVEILSKIQYKVIFHVIGSGEKKDNLINEVSGIGVEVIDHGQLYNLNEKRKIFEKCHFGMNIMKKSVFVGLTMKSIDYLESGLPLINNIPGDTKKMVDEFGIGINFDRGVVTTQKIDIDRKFFDIEVRNKTRDVCEKMFSFKNGYKKMDTILRELELGEEI